MITCYDGKKSHMLFIVSGLVARNVRVVFEGETKCLSAVS